MYPFAGTYSQSSKAENNKFGYVNTYQIILTTFQYKTHTLRSLKL